MRSKEKETGPSDAEIAVEAPAPARLTVTTPGSWGEVFVDGKKLGRAGKGEEFEIAPGHHTLRVENPTSKSFEQGFDIAAGETRQIPATLEPLPYIINFVDFDPMCVVALDGVGKGPIGPSLGGALAIAAPDPNKEYTVTVTCGKEEPFVKTLRGLHPSGSKDLHR